VLEEIALHQAAFERIVLLRNMAELKRGG